MPDGDQQITGETGARDARGRFRGGRSGNPAGRPRGSVNRATRAAMLLLDGEAEALTRKAVEPALAGDPVALRLCLERILGARRGRPVDLGTLALPPLTDAGDLAGAMATVATAPICQLAVASERRAEKRKRLPPDIQLALQGERRNALRFSALQPDAASSCAGARRNSLPRRRRGRFRGIVP